ncbi:MAG TPA: hypothetical protein VMA13_07300 [Candidatus Saccharimonadales bacterium]|nr:hypothetical protein [Candidatus Saccharimonadales bacterium]
MSAFLEISITHSQAQQNAVLLEFAGDTNALVRPISEWHSSTNSVSAVLTWNRPMEEGTNLELKLDFAQKGGRSLSSIIDEVGTERAESTLASARVFTEDLMSSMNRDASDLRSPVELTDHHVASVFRDTARDSLGVYVKQNYHPSGIVEILWETLLDNSFDKRIVSPFSPAGAGNPGTAYAKKGGIHVGLRNIWSANPRGFVTFSDKAEIDVTPNNPSITLRDPLYLDHSDNREALITALAVNYPDWQVNKWSIPNVGATISYVYDNESVNLTASAGRCNFESSCGSLESRYGEQVMLYAQCTF